MGTLQRAVNDIHLLMGHCDSYHVAILSTETSKYFNRKIEDQFGSGL